MVLEDLFLLPSTLVRFRKPPLGPSMDGFCEWLQVRGCSAKGIRRRARQVLHFNDYLRRRSVKTTQQVRASHAERFIEKHLPSCRCRQSHGHGYDGTPQSTRYLIDYLSERGFIALPLPTCPPKQSILQEYLEYLKDERHLAKATLEAYQMYINRLLKELGADPKKGLSKLSPKRILVFFAKYAQGRGLSSRRCFRNALLSFFRFCRRRGYLEYNLAEAVPRIRSYRLSDVPRGISDEDARKTLEAIDRTTPVGQRDFAMIQLLRTYGVRGAQVRALRVEDIRWRESRILFAACKGGKEVVESLTEEVGESLLQYLRYGRPQVRCPEVFLTIHPPYRPMGSACRLFQIVRERMRKAGVSQPTGPHAFRHGFATRMLRHGQSMKTIADLLGHRNINSTFIYTKVDFQALVQLPLDWPEV